MSGKKNGFLEWGIAIVTGAAGFAVNKAISKMDSIQKMGRDKYPGVVPALVSGAMTGGAIAIRKEIKDEKIRFALIIGSGIATVERGLNVEMIRKNLPDKVQSLFAGDEDPTVIRVTPSQLENLLSEEASRREASRLPDNSSQQTIAGETGTDTVDEDDLGGEDESFAYRSVGGDDDSIFR